MQVDAALLAAALGRFRRALVRDGFLGAVRALADTDLSVTQIAALYLLDEEADGLTVGQVAERLGRSLPATSRLLDKLVERRLVTRREDERDRRARRVALAERGCAFIGELERRRADAQLALMAYLTEQEQSDVLRAAQLLADAAGRRDDDRGRPPASREPPDRG